MQIIGSHLGRLEVPDKGGGLGSTKEGGTPLRFSTSDTQQDMVSNIPPFLKRHLRPIATCGLEEGCTLRDIYTFLYIYIYMYIL